MAFVPFKKKSKKSKSKKSVQTPDTRGESMKALYKATQ